jgi:hypothetical protein
MPSYKIIFSGLIWLSLLVSSSGYTDDRFTVRDIQVDVKDSSVMQARMKAIAEGQRGAFKVLMGRLLSSDDMMSLPELSDAQLDTLLQDFEVQNEKNSAVRYMGTLTFRFNPSRVKEFFAHSHKHLLPATRNTTVVIVPVYEGLDETQLWEEGNPWRNAWNDYLNDMSDLPVQSVLKGNTQNILRLMNRYHAEQVLTAVLKRDFPFILDIHMYNKEGLSYIEESIPLLGEENLTPAMAHKAIQKTLEIVRNLEMKNEDSAIAASLALTRPVECRIPFSTHKEWLQIQRKLSTLPSIRKIEVLSLNRRQALVSLDYIGNEQRMQSAMEGEGFKISSDPEATGRKLVKWQKTFNHHSGLPVPESVSPSLPLREKANISTFPTEEVMR